MPMMFGQRRLATPVGYPSGAAACRARRAEPATPISSRCQRRASVPTLPDPAASLHIQSLTAFAAPQPRSRVDIAYPCTGRYAAIDGTERRFDLRGRDAGLFQTRRTVGQQRVDHHRVARPDRQHRLVGGVVMSPGDRLRRRPIRRSQHPRASPRQPERQGSGDASSSPQ